MKLIYPFLCLFALAGCSSESSDSGSSNTALKANFSGASSVAVGFGQTSGRSLESQNAVNHIQARSGITARNADIPQVEYNSNAGGLIKLLSGGTAENVLNGDWTIYHLDYVSQLNSANKSYVILSGEFPEILADTEESEEVGVTCYLMAFEKDAPDSLGTCLSEEKIGVYDNAGAHRSFDAFGDSPAFAVNGTNVYFLVNGSANVEGQGFRLYRWSSETMQKEVLMSKPKIGAASDIYAYGNSGNFCFFSPNDSGRALNRRAGLERYSYCYNGTSEEFVEFSSLLSGDQLTRYNTMEQQLEEANAESYEIDVLGNNNVVLHENLSENMFSLGSYVILSSLHYINMDNLEVTTIPTTWNADIAVNQVVDHVVTSDPLLKADGTPVVLSSYLNEETFSLTPNQAIDNICRTDTKAIATSELDNDWIFDINNTSGALEITEIDKDSYIKAKLEDNGEFDLSTAGMVGFGGMYFDGNKDCWGYKEYTAAPFGIFYLNVEAAGADIISDNYLKRSLVAAAGLELDNIEGIKRIDVVGDKQLSVVLRYNGGEQTVLIDHSAGTLALQVDEQESYTRLVPVEE